jgi:DnaD/phage-associated family protein
MAGNGFVKLYRELLDNPIWTKSTSEQKAILITILLMANHKVSEWEWQGAKFSVLPGQFVTSLDSIAVKSGTSVQNVRSAIKKFISYNFLTDESTKTGRLITIVNWHLYQAKKERTNKATNIPTNKEVTKTQQRGNKEVTPNKNDKNYILRSSSEPDTNFQKVQEVFDNNIHPMTPIELEIIDEWMTKVNADVIVLAITEAVKQNARKIKYIEGILQDWYSKGLETQEKVEAYQRDWKDKQQQRGKPKPPKQDKYTYKKVKGCDYGDLDDFYNKKLSRE